MKNKLNNIAYRIYKKDKWKLDNHVYFIKNHFINSNNETIYVCDRKWINEKHLFNTKEDALNKIKKLNVY